MNKLNMEYCGTTKEEVPDTFGFEWAQENPLEKTSHRKCCQDDGSSPSRPKGNIAQRNRVERETYSLNSKSLGTDKV